MKNIAPCESYSKTQGTIAQYFYAYGGRAVFDALNPCLRLFGEYYDLDDCRYGLRGTNSRSRNSDGLMILPNPANEELIIKTDRSEANKLPEELQVIDNLGKSFDLEVKRVDSFILVANVKQMVNGVYFISAEQNGQRKLFKFIVSH